MEELPTVAEELNRKTIDTLISLQQRFDTRQITANEHFVAIEAIFSTVSGLVSEECTKILSANQPERAWASCARFRDDNGKQVVIEHFENEPIVYTTSMDNGVVKRTVKDFGDDPEYGRQRAAKYFTALRERLVQSSFYTEE